jgi:hypothetical protein
MATFICSKGDDFIVQQEDRGYNGKLTEVLKVDGGTGTVTVAGQTISSSGVVGATGAVTATTGAFSGTLAAAAAATVGTTLTVTGAAALNGGVAVTGAATVGGKTVATGALRSVVSVGVDASGGAADVTMASTLVGDQLVAAFNHTDGTDVQTDFEATVTVAGKLHQTAANLSAKTILFLFHRA